MRQDGTTILFGLRGVRVREVAPAPATATADDDGMRVVHVVTDDESAAACVVCGALSRSVRQWAGRTHGSNDMDAGPSQLRRPAPITSQFKREDSPAYLALHEAGAQRDDANPPTRPEQRRSDDAAGGRSSGPAPRITFGGRAVQAGESGGERGAPAIQTSR